MPWTPPTVYANGTVMDWTQIASDFSDLRSYVNAVPAADLADGSVRRDQLLRPEVLGWPTQAMLGEAQVNAWMDADHLGVGLPLHRLGWGSRPDRVTIIPASLAGNFTMTRVGRTLELHDGWDHDVLIHVQGSAWVTTNPTTSTGPYYSDGAGAALTKGGLGWLHLYRFDREAGTRTKYTVGRAKLYPRHYDIGASLTDYGHDRWHVCYYERLPGGKTYDFVLGFEKENESSVVQIDLADIAFHVEVS